MAQATGLADRVLDLFVNIVSFPMRRGGISLQQFARLSVLENEFEHVKISRGRYTVGNNRPYGMVVQYRGKVIGMAYADAFIFKDANLRGDPEIEALYSVIRARGYDTKKD